MRYEIALEKWDDAGRFVGRVEVFSDDMSWRSGVSDVTIGNPNATKSEIEAALRKYADDHEAQYTASLDKAQPKAPKISLTKGIIDSKNGNVVGAAKNRDAEGREKP